MSPILIRPFIQLVLYVHMALFPVKVIQTQSLRAMSVVDTLRLNHEVVQGWVCSSPSDIECIDDVCNEDGKYWTIEINGDYANVNSRTIIKPSDRLVLKYASSREK